MKSIIMGLVLALSLCVFPGRAEAKKGIPFIYNTGEEAFATGPLPAPFDEAEELEGYQAGYLCNIKGVLWSYFSVDECKPVAFKDDTYTDEPEIVEAITAKYTEADMQRGLWGRFGWVLLAGLVVFGVLIWIKEAITGK